MTAPGCAFIERTKVSHSGQVRVYYAAGCECGWRRNQFRVTLDRARDDWRRHAPDAPPTLAMAGEVL